MRVLIYLVCITLSESIVPEQVLTYGDQMTRKNLDLARGLRIDNDTVTEGLKVQSPMICAPWHIKQDMLEVCLLSKVKLLSII